MRRWSQNLLKTNNINSGKKTMRQRTINFMPSRNRLISSDGHISTSLQDSKVEQLAQEIEQHDHLMEDSAFGEQLRMSVLYSLLYFYDFTLFFFYPLQCDAQSSAPIVDH